MRPIAVSALLVTLLACDLCAQEAPSPAPVYAEPMVRTYDRAVHPSRLANPWQVRFKVIVADVEPANWDEVEQAVGKIQNLSNRPQIDDATIEDLKARNLISVITRPMLGASDGGIVTIQFGRRDVGLTDGDDELHELELSGKREASTIHTEIKWTVHYDHRQTVNLSVGTNVHLKLGEFVALAMLGLPSDRNEGRPGGGKVLFISASRGPGSSTVRFERAQPAEGSHPPSKR